LNESSKKGAFSVGSRVNRLTVSQSHLIIRRRVAVSFALSLVLMLAGISTATAFAQSSAKPQTAPVANPPVLNLPAGDLEPVLSSLPVSDFALSEAELGQLLSELNPGLGSSLGQLTAVVSNLLGENPDANLGELVDRLSSQGGVLGTLLHILLPSLNPAQIFAALSPTQVNELLANLTGGNPAGMLTPEDLSQLLSELAGKLSGEEQESLTAILGGLTAALSGGGLSKFDESLQTLLDGLGESELGGTLGTLDSSQLATVLGELFGTVQNPALLEPVLGSLLGDLSLTPTTAESLASRVGMEQETLANALGEDSETLPSTAPALASVIGGKGTVMGVLKGAKGLAMTLLSPTGLVAGEGIGVGEGNGEGNGGGDGGNNGGGNGGSSSGGGQGGPGGSGGGTTLIVNVPLSGSPTSAPAKTASPKKFAKIAIVSHKVKGSVATVLVKVPAAGKLTLSGKGVTTEIRKAGKAERIALRVKLSKAGSASLRRHRRRLKVTLTASFKAVGTATSAKTTVLFN
jgi:hypothetical protein